MLQFNLLASDRMSSSHCRPRATLNRSCWQFSNEIKTLVIREWRRRVREKMKWIGLKSERKVNIFNGVTFFHLKILFLRFLCLYIRQGHSEPKQLTHFVNWKLMNSIRNMRLLVISLREWLPNETKYIKLNLLNYSENIFQLIHFRISFYLQLFKGVEYHHRSQLVCQECMASIH